MDERIRVAQLFITFDIENIGGGHSRFAIDLGNTLAQDRFDVVLCSLGFETEMSRERIETIRRYGRKVFVATDRKLGDRTKPFQFITSSYSALAAHFNQHPVDIIHSHAEFTDILALGLKQFSGISKIVRTVHTAYPQEWIGKPVRRLLFTDILHPVYFDSEIGINNQNTTRLNNRLIARLYRRDAQCIHNAVDLGRFHAKSTDILEIKHALKIPEDTFVIGSIGRLDDQKGYTYLLSAAETVLKTRPNTVFVIIGDGPLENSLVNQAIQLKILNNVIFTGSRSDIYELLSIMDIFVSSSIWEGFPTVLLESMACEVPILATDNPGTRELIQHGETGWLVPSQDAAALSAGLVMMINSPALRRDLSNRARKEVEKFSIVNIAKQYEDLYERLYLENHARETH